MITWDDIEQNKRKERKAILTTVNDPLTTLIPTSTAIALCNFVSNKYIVELTAVFVLWLSV